MKLKGEKLAINRLERALSLVDKVIKSNKLLPDEMTFGGKSLLVNSFARVTSLYGVVIILRTVIDEQYRRLKMREETDLWQQRLA